jgi:hypothetical protein
LGQEIAGSFYHIGIFSYLAEMRKHVCRNTTRADATSQ